MNFFGLTLGLAVAIVAMDCLFALYGHSVGIASAVSTIWVRIAVDSAVVFGLWGGSRTTRYAAVLWNAIGFVAAFAPVVTGKALAFGPGLVIVWSTAALNIGLIGFLLSKPFAKQFAAETQSPPYKPVLRKYFLYALVAVVVILTLRDVYYLFVV